jgi:hypothetical protein
MIPGKRLFGTPPKGEKRRIKPHDSLMTNVQGTVASAEFRRNLEFGGESPWEMRDRADMI